MSASVVAPDKTAREEILGRIRAALPGEPASVDASYATISRTYQRRGTLDREANLDLLIDRLVDYDSEIVKVQDETAIAAAVAGILAASGETSLLADSAVPSLWLPSDVTLIVDDGLDTEQIDAAQAVLTTCEAAVASTGTIFLVHGGAQGRRVATLLPDHHICVIREGQVYETVPEALAALDHSDPRPITTVSGPSATSDIEMTRIRGVHGPRRLTVILHTESRPM
jgi:L-lactate dehydrogenase complex protein LldG